MKPPNAYSGIRGNITALLQDGLRLADLQMQLLGLDARDFWRLARFSLALCIIGAVAMLAALPVMLLGFSEYLRAWFEVPLELARVLIGAVTLIVGAVAVWWSFKRLSRAASIFSRSQKELQENLTWFREVLNQERD